MTETDSIEDCGCDWCSDEALVSSRTRRSHGRCRGSVEQVGKAHHTSIRHKRSEKRYTVRLMRRMGRMFLDNAPRRIPFRGWSD